MVTNARAHGVSGPGPGERTKVLRCLWLTGSGVPEIVVALGFGMQLELLEKKIKNNKKSRVVLCLCFG